MQLAWKAGRSDNLAHFRFTPGAHGGTATAFDDAASELIDPDFDRPPLRPVAPVPTSTFDGPRPRPLRDAAAPAAPSPRPSRRAARRGKPADPGWEDVLLGVRSSGQR